MNENWTAEDRKQSTELLEQGCQTHHHVSWNGSRCKTGFWNLTSNTPLPWTGAGHHQQRERNAWEERTNHARRARQHNACQRKIRTMKRNAKKDVTQTRQKKVGTKTKTKVNRMENISSCILLWWCVFSCPASSNQFRFKNSQTNLKRRLWFF